MILMTLFMLSCQREEVKPRAGQNISNVENRTVEPCAPVDAEEMPYVKDTENWLIQLPLFDTCSFLVQTEVFDCGSLGYYFGNYKILFHDCDSFDTWINNCTGSGSSFESCMDLLNNQIMEALAIEKATTENPPNPNIAVYFYNAACHQYCTYENYDPRTEKYYYTFSRLRCSDACCIHTYELTKINGVWTITDSAVEQYAGTECDFVLQVESCDVGAIYTSSCIHQCE